MLLATALLAAAAACGRPLRPAPIERGATHDWPTLLGNVQRSGFSHEVPPDRLEEEWRADVGRGLYSPVLVDGPVLLVATGNRMVAALSVETGDHYWERRLDGPITGGLVRRDTRVYLATEARGGKTYALDLLRGGRAWDRSIGSSPFPALLIGHAVYVATERGQLVALAAENGQPLWRAGLPDAATATPVPHGESIVVATRADTLVVVERTTGTITARAPLPGGVSAPPAVTGDTLLVPLHVGDVVAFGMPELHQLWTSSLGAPILAPPVVAPDRSVYLLTSAAEVWRIPPGGRAGIRIAALGGAARGSLTLAGDRLLVGRLDGTLLLLRTNGEVVWQKKFEDSIVAPVTVHDGALYVPLLRGTIVKLR